MAHCNSREEPSLVILAAGQGRRFGGGKQWATVGDSGKPLMYFSVMDAWRAGVRRLVLVVDPASVSQVETTFLPLLPEGLVVTLAPQRAEDLPPGCAARPRGKPWGTGHALWCARDAVAGPCIVINADDYYGPGAWPRLVTHFESGDGWAMVSYPLASTLSEFGAVNRGLCEVRDGYLRSVRECHSIIHGGDEIRGEIGGHRVLLDPDTPVSMNIWGFSRNVFDCLERGLARFFESRPGTDGEWYLPDQVMASIAASEGRVRVYTGGERWVGVTYREDLLRVAEVLHEPGESAHG